MPLLPAHMLSFVRPMIATEITMKKLQSQKFASSTKKADTAISAAALSKIPITHQLPPDSHASASSSFSPERRVSSKTADSGNGLQQRKNSTASFSPMQSENADSRSGRKQRKEILKHSKTSGDMNTTEQEGMSQ